MTMNPIPTKASAKVLALALAGASSSASVNTSPESRPTFCFLRVTRHFGHLALVFLIYFFCFVPSVLQYLQK